MAYSRALSLNLPGQSEENHEKLQSGYPARWLRFKPGIP
jgi:hypothetical protein